MEEISQLNVLLPFDIVCNHAQLWPLLVSFSDNSNWISSSPPLVVRPKENGQNQTIHLRFSGNNWVTINVSS